MAGVAILGDLLLSALVIAVVASETSGKIHVPEVVGIGPPVDSHGGEDVAVVNVNQCLCSLLHLGALRIINAEVILSVVFP